MSAQPVMRRDAVGGWVRPTLAPSISTAAAASGVLEATGLTLWGAHLWRIMAGRYSVAASQGPSAVTRPLTLSPLAGDVLDHHPSLLSTLVAFGFRPLLNPILQRTLTHRVTLQQACRVAGVDLPTLLDALNNELSAGTAGACTLPVVEAEPPPARAKAGCSCPAQRCSRLAT